MKLCVSLTLSSANLNNFLTISLAVGSRFHLVAVKEYSAQAHPGMRELLLIMETTWI